MTFQKPLPKTKVASNPSETDAILEEDFYVSKLVKIITRDFFPELHKIKEIYNQEGRQDEGDVEIKLKLDEFLDSFNSEDNHSFGQILEKQKENWKQKFWWMFKNDEPDRLALPKSEKSEAKMLENGKTLMLTNGEENDGSLLFFPESKKNALTYSETSEKHSERINYENTRFPSTLTDNILSQANRNRIPSISGSASPAHNGMGLGLGFKTPDLLGYKRKEENQNISLQELMKNNTISETSSMTKKLSFKNEVNGYDLLKLPSPSPNDFKSPLMTWGEVEDTPLRIDTQKYKLPETPERDILKNKLANSFTAKRKISKKLQARRMQSLLSNTPKRLSSDLSSASRLSSKQPPLHYVPANLKKKN